MTREFKPPAYAEWQRRSPCRPTDWRWRRACSLAAQGRRAKPAQDDALTGPACRYLSRLHGGPPDPGRPARASAAIPVARRVHRRGGSGRRAAEAQRNPASTWPDAASRPKAEQREPKGGTR
jgi:hypothetical protein